MLELKKVLNILNCSRIIKGFFVVGDQGARSALRLGITITIARLCLKSDFSFYTILQATFVYILLFFTSFVYGPYVVFIHNKKNNDKYEYSQEVRSIFCLFILFVCVIYLSIYGIIFEKQYYGLFVLFSSVFFIASDIVNVSVRAAFVAEFRYRSAFVVAIFSMLIYFSVVTLLFYFKGLSLVNVFLVAGVSYMAPSLIAYLRIDNNKIAFCSAKRLKVTFIEHFQFGKWIFLSNILNTIMFVSFPFFLRSMGKNDLISEYGAYFNFFMIFNPIILVLNNFFSPRLASAFQKGKDSFVKAFRSGGVLIVFLSIVFLVGIYFFGNHLFCLFYGSEFQMITSVMMWWAGSKILEFSSCLLSCAVRASHQPVYDFLSSSIGCLLFVMLGLAMIKSYELFGVSLSLFITRLGSFLGLFLFFILNKKIKILYLRIKGTLNFSL